jgi:hypothetical protein
MRRDGSFVVELFTPLKHEGRDVEAIIIRAPTYEHSIRWGRQQIPSGLALLAELTDLPERLLRQITAPDVDRVTFALLFAQATWAQKDINEGRRPFATPDEELPSITESKVSDQQDPRFPHVEGPVKRYPTPPKVVIPPEEKDVNLNFAPPEAMKAVS